MKRLICTGVAALSLVGAGVAVTTAVRAADDPNAKIVDYYRRKANVPPNVTLQVEDVKPSTAFKGAKSAVIVAGNRKVPVTMSEDGRYLVFGEVEDITVDPFKAVMEKVAVKNRPFKGGENAKVTIVEYSDFQCPFCTRGYNTMENQVLKEYGDKVKFYYKHFPLPMHPWAQPAAVATECALLQNNKDAYWKLYNFYFEHQKEITPQNLKEKTAEALKDSKIDMAKFNECFDGNKTADEVKAQMTEGQSVGVTGTPGFIINGRLVSGAQPFENFKAVIDDELNRKS
ncbi:DsbA family protein [Candidatus Binatia bacterium]|nr:DsbA family protein [Candidatus Binatia bacterium]